MTQAPDFSWKCTVPEVLPDFIIGGAMKSGTTTLHQVLAKHPKIQFAHEELGFFDMDEWLQHSDYHFYDAAAKTWHSPLLVEHPKALWDWYYSQFPKRIEGNLMGEDSTTYLASDRVAERLAIQDKRIKVLFILRHPTDRTISNYLHALKSGRAIYNFEDTLKYDPHSILKRSLYLEQLNRYYQVLPKEQIHVVLFEDFLKDRKQVLGDICQFLGISFEDFPVEAFSLHANKTLVPKSVRLQLWRNRLLQKGRDVRYTRFLPDEAVRNQTLSKSYRLIHKVHKKLNPLGSIKSFEVEPSTRHLLDVYFKQTMVGLDDLVGKPILATWFKD